MPYGIDFLYENNLGIVDYKSKLTLEKALHIASMYLDPDYTFVVGDMKRGVDVAEFLKTLGENKKSECLIEKLKEKNVIK